MKNLLVLFLIYSSCLFSQTDSLKYVSWEQALKMHPDSVFYLNAVKLKWKELPKDIVNFKNLKSINLQGNKLKSLPNYLKQFKNLQSVNISKNNFDTLPEVIYTISSLEKLNFSRNNISFIANEIENLKQLKYIDFWDNPIENFPEAFLKMSKLKAIHAEGIRYGPKFQAYWKEILPNATLFFDPPCDCKE